MKQGFTFHASFLGGKLYSNHLWEKIISENLSSFSKNHDYEKLISDPFLFEEDFCGLRSPLDLPDLELAITFLNEAIENDSSIMIIGDKDVDGVCSTALLNNFLIDRFQEKIEGKLEVIVSDLGDDYGLSGGVFERALATNAKLIFLLDMGTSNGREIERLLVENKKVIVLDHHLILDKSPNFMGCAFINPQRNLECHSYHHEGKIATVGLVFKFLLGYALSHLQEWKRLYCFPVFDTKIRVFRLGHYVGEFETMNSLKNWIHTTYTDKKNKYTYLNPLDFKYFIFDAQGEMINNEGNINIANESFNWEMGEWNYFQDHLNQAGRILLSKIIKKRPRLESFIIKYSDLPALGLITDMVPLVDENRSLVRIGIGQVLSKLKRGTRDYNYGFSALIRALGLNEERILSKDLSWSIGPTVNAAGRMGNTQLALQLLTSGTNAQASVLAQKLVALNQKRKRLTLRNELLLKNHFSKNLFLLDKPILFCYHPDLEKGVSGIIATRLTEEYKKPVVYINHDEKFARGSFRSWDGVNVLNILDKFSYLFIQFGGHAEAAGFSITFDNIEKFEQALLNIDEENLRELLKSQVKPAIASIPIATADLNYKLLDDLEHLEPFGSGNPEPIFSIRGIQIKNLHFLSKGTHASFQVKDAHPNLKFIAWRKGEFFNQLLYSNKKNKSENQYTKPLTSKSLIENEFENSILANYNFDLVGNFEMNTFRNYSELIFKVKQISIA